LYFQEKSEQPMTISTAMEISVSAPHTPMPFDAAQLCC